MLSFTYKSLLSRWSILRFRLPYHWLPTLSMRYQLFQVGCRPLTKAAPGRRRFGSRSEPAGQQPRFAVIREGFEAEDDRLRKIAEEYDAKRFEEIQKAVARNYDRPFRVSDVYVFDPATQSRTGPHSVQVTDNRISGVFAVDTPLADGEIVIEGNGGTLVAGMYEMHGHTGQEQALLNIAAGVTSLRDMGNNNEVLSSLI